MKTFFVNTLSSAIVRKAALALTLVALSSFAAAQSALAGNTTKPQNIVVNGGFEQGTAGWSGSGNAYLGTNSCLANSGNNFAYFTGDQDSTISQTLQTQAGENYTFTFYADDSNCDCCNDNVFDILWNGQTVKGSPTSLKSTCLGDYVPYTFTVTATQAATALEFIINPNSGSNCGSGVVLLDDVSVIPAGSSLATPEPSSMALLMIGALGLSGSLFLRRRNATIG